MTGSGSCCCIKRRREAAQEEEVVDAVLESIWAKHNLVSNFADGVTKKRKCNITTGYCRAYKASSSSPLHSSSPWFQLLDCQSKDANDMRRARASRALHSLKETILMVARVVLSYPGRKSCRHAPRASSPSNQYTGRLLIRARPPDMLAM